MAFSTEKLKRKLKRAFPRHIIYLTGYPTAHGGINVLYDLPADEVITYGLDDYGALVFEWISASEYCEEYKESAEYEVDLVRSVSTRSPKPLERWGIPADAWRRAWRKGDMYSLRWDYVTEKRPTE